MNHLINRMNLSSPAQRSQFWSVAVNHFKYGGTSPCPATLPVKHRAKNHGTGAMALFLKLLAGSLGEAVLHVEMSHDVLKFENRIFSVSGKERQVAYISPMHHGI